MRHWGAEDRDQILQEAEQRAATGDREGALAVLRRLSLDQFAFLVWHLPNGNLPRLSALLPDGPTIEAQQNWTGGSGDALVAVTLRFIRSLAWHADRFSTPLPQARTLDYGCGYGRMLRMLEYFAPAASIYGCDAWSGSLDLCRKARMPFDLRQIDPAPESLPYPQTIFDVVYAFSIFTHLPIDVMEKALSSIRKLIAPNGLLAVTIRPYEYWTFTGRTEAPDAATLVASHKANGFAFLPQKRADFGDTSMTVDFLASRATGWRVAATDWNHDDALQQIVYLRPA